MVVFVFKEAYEEFKHVLLAFIYDKDDMTSPVANEVCLSPTFILQRGTRGGGNIAMKNHDFRVPRIQKLTSEVAHCRS